MRLRCSLLVALLAAAIQVSADHLAGGSVTYECLGGNFYRITLTMYRDCLGTEVVPQSLSFSNDCGVNFTVSNIVHDEEVFVAPVCADQAGNSTCDDGPLFGMKKYVFHRELFLSPCSGWRIFWSVCCRPTVINANGNAGLYIVAELDNTGGACNNSPYFTDHMPPLVCAGQAMHHDPMVVEADGDSLVFSLVDARYAAPVPQPIFYQIPWFGAIPFTDLTIDPITGRISYLPSVQGSVVVVVQVDEYQPGGAWKGSVLRDYNFTTTPCDNNVPAINAGTITSVVGDGVLTGSRSAALCSGGTGCMQMVFTDVNSTQALEVSSNVELVLPGAELTLSGTNPVVATICWDALAMPPGTRHFGIKVLDDACPYRGLQTYTYTMTIHPTPEPFAGGSALTCSQLPEFFLADSMAAPPPPGGVWTDPTGAPHSGWFNPATDPAGAYSYTVTSFPNCKSFAEVQVTMLPDDDPMCDQLGVGSITAVELRVHPNPMAGGAWVSGLQVPAGSAVPYHLLDMQGSKRSQGTLLAGGASSWFALPQDLANGTYLLVFPTSAVIRPHRVVLIR